MLFTDTLEELQSKFAEYKSVYQGEIDNGRDKIHARIAAANRLHSDAPDFLYQLIDTMQELESLKEGIKDALEIPEYTQNDDDRTAQTSWNSGFNHARLKFRAALMKHKVTYTAAEPTTLYIQHTGHAYRFKLLTTMLMIERQPDGENIPFPREGIADAAYDDDLGAWDYEAIGKLIAVYESDTR